METIKTTEITTKQVVTIEDLKKMSPGTYMSTGVVRFANPFDNAEVLTGTFNIFDGVAFGTAIIDGVERELVAEYPLLRIVNGSAKTMKENIRKHLNIEEERDITVYEIFSSYGQFRVLEQH